MMSLASSFTTMVSSAALRQVTWQTPAGRITSTTPTAATRRDNRIVRRIGMIVRALRLANITARPTVATAHILSMYHRLQVIGICAWRIIAQVIKLESIKNGADQQLVHEPVNRQATTSHPDLPVTIPIRVSPPNPTTIWLGTQTFKQSANQPCMIHTWSLP